MSRIIAIVAALVALALPAAADAATAAKPNLYVSLGDSYAAGYQRNGPGNAGRTTTHGFADQLVPRLAKRGFGTLKLINFGCGGATTASMLLVKGCVPPARAVNQSPYGPRTQTAAAARFLKAHRGRVALVTISIGGNDVTACAKAPDPVACVSSAVTTLKTNLALIVKRLRAAAGKGTTIVGLTYPDVLLGFYAGGTDDQKKLASLSVTAFKALINPALKATYAAAKARFVDITQATGAYTPLDQTTTLAPFGTLPIAAAKVCAISYYCTLRDIHLFTKGYGLMADIIARSLPRR